MSVGNACHPSMSRAPASDRAPSQQRTKEAGVHTRVDQLSGTSAPARARLPARASTDCLTKKNKSSSESRAKEATERRHQHTPTNRTVQTCELETCCSISLLRCVCLLWRVPQQQTELASYRHSSLPAQSFAVVMSSQQQQNDGHQHRFPTLYASRTLGTVRDAATARSLGSLTHASHSGTTLRLSPKVRTVVLIMHSMHRVLTPL